MSFRRRCVARALALVMVVSFIGSSIAGGVDGIGAAALVDGAGNAPSAGAGAAQTATLPTAAIVAGAVAGPLLVALVIALCAHGAAKASASSDVEDQREAQQQSVPVAPPQQQGLTAEAALPSRASDVALADAAAYNTTTVDAPLGERGEDTKVPAVVPHQPANPISTTTTVSKPPSAPMGAKGPKPAGVGYESDDGEGGVERKLQAASLAHAGRASHVQLRPAGTTLASALAAQATNAAQKAKPAENALVVEAVKVAVSPTNAAAPEALGHGETLEPSVEIDLNIDLSKGELKVDYSTRGLLGQGGFAAVYKGRYRGERVAVKMIKKTNGTTIVELQEDINALKHELNILRTVQHPNIVTLYGGCLKPPHIFLVEERMEGTLDFYVHTIRKPVQLTVREAVLFALDIARGLSYLHPTVVHRDLKPANVLLSRDGCCKISDFGLARYKMKEYLSTKNLDAGTTAYIAPECFMSMDNPDMTDLRRSVTDKCDIYALAVIMWEMLSGKRPWQGLKPLLVAYQVAYRSLRPPLFELGERCPAGMQRIIEDCWAQDPKNRPSSVELVTLLEDLLQRLPADQVTDPTTGQPLPMVAGATAPAAAAGGGRTPGGH